MEVFISILAIISILSICAAFFFLGQAYEIMQEMKRDTKEWSKR
jgi:hypothetical protein